MSDAGEQMTKPLKNPPKWWLAIRRKLALNQDPAAAQSGSPIQQEPESPTLKAIGQFDEQLGDYIKSRGPVHNTEDWK